MTVRLVKGKLFLPFCHDSTVRGLVSLTPLQRHTTAAVPPQSDILVVNQKNCIFYLTDICLIVNGAKACFSSKNFICPEFEPGTLCASGLYFKIWPSHLTIADKLQNSTIVLCPHYQYTFCNILYDLATEFEMVGVRI